MVTVAMASSSGLELIDKMWEEWTLDKFMLVAKAVNRYLKEVHGTKKRGKKISPEAFVAQLGLAPGKTIGVQ